LHRIESDIRGENFWKGSHHEHSNSRSQIRGVVQARQELRRDAHDVLPEHRFHRERRKANRRSAASDYEAEDRVADKILPRRDRGRPVLQRWRTPTSSPSTSRSTSPPKATGKRFAFEEVAVYTVGKDDKITREQFFYEAGALIGSAAERNDHVCVNPNPRQARQRK